MTKQQYSLTDILPTLMALKADHNYSLLLSEAERYLCYGPNNSELLAYKFQALCGLKEELNDIGFLRKYCWYNGLDEHAYFSLAQAYLNENDPNNALIALVYCLSVNCDFTSARCLLNITLQDLSYDSVKVYFLTPERIGHLVIEPESWLRKQAFQPNKENNLNLFISGEKPANQFFFKLLKNKVEVIENPFWTKLYGSRPALISDEFYRKMPYDLKSCLREKNTIYNENNLLAMQSAQQSTPPILSLQPNELALGWEVLSNYGITQNHKIVCFHVRDSAYLLNSANPINDEYHDVRDMDIASYEKSISYLLSKGYIVIRIGSETNQQLYIEHENYLDFCLQRDKENGDFLDVFLLSICQFFIGNTSGILAVANCFDTPVLGVNMVPIGVFHPPNMRYIPKHYVDKVGKEISFSSLWNNMELVIDGKLKKGLSGCFPTHVLVDNSLSFIDNSESEILESVVEFESAIVDRKFHSTLTPLQLSYLKSLPDNFPMKYSTSVLTDSFLRTNIDSFNLRDNV